MDSLSYKTRYLNKAAVERSWLLVDAAHQPLGRVASRIAFLLRGKHKPGYTPHVDCGDKIVVINAEKVHLTGRKGDQREHLRHTGYPGGQRSQTPNQILEKHPERLIEQAVKGMLPRTRLGREIYHNLFVYAGAEHPHDAQQPTPIELSL